MRFRDSILIVVIAAMTAWIFCNWISSGAINSLFIYYLHIIGTIVTAISVVGIGGIYLASSELYNHPNPITHAIWGKLYLKMKQDPDLILYPLICLMSVFLWQGRYMLSFISIALPVYYIDYFMTEYKLDIERITKNGSRKT